MLVVGSGFCDSVSFLLVGVCDIDTIKRVMGRWVIKGKRKF